MLVSVVGVVRVCVGNIEENLYTHNIESWKGLNGELVILVCTVCRPTCIPMIVMKLTQW